MAGVMAIALPGCGFSFTTVWSRCQQLFHQTLDMRVNRGLDEWPFLILLFYTVVRSRRAREHGRAQELCGKRLSVGRLEWWLQVCVPSSRHLSKGSDLSHGGGLAGPSQRNPVCVDSDF